MIYFLEFALDFFFMKESYKQKELIFSFYESFSELPLFQVCPLFFSRKYGHHTHAQLLNLPIALEFLVGSPTTNQS